MEYHIVTCTNVIELGYMVNKKLLLGWGVSGGICAIHRTNKHTINTTYYHQAMVREKASE